MQVVDSFRDLRPDREVTLTIGAFDGVHRGHQWLIGQVVDHARRQDRLSAAVTFDPRPSVVLRPGELQLTDGKAKAEFIAALGIDLLVVLPFSPETAAIPAIEFLGSLRRHLHLAEVWTGADFAFGFKRQGTVEFLQAAGSEHGFAVQVVSRQDIDGRSISSSSIRQLVVTGRVTEAAELSGHYPGYYGPVVTGFGRGRDLGFPTANVQPPEYQLLPATGIYAAYLRHRGTRLPAAVSVGTNPVFGGQSVVVEAFVLDFDGDLRDQMVGLEFVARLRDEENFPSVAALVTQMHRDVARVPGMLAAAPRL